MICSRLAAELRLACEDEADKETDACGDGCSLCGIAPNCSLKIVYFLRGLILHLLCCRPQLFAGKLLNS